MSNFNGSTSPSPWPIQNNPNTGERSIWNTQNTLFDFSSLPLNNPPMPNNGWQNLNGLSLTDSPWKNNTNGLQVQPTVNKLNNKLSSVHGNCKLRTCWEHVVYTNCFLFLHSEQFMHTACSQQYGKNAALCSALCNLQYLLSTYYNTYWKL